MLKKIIVAGALCLGGASGAMADTLHITLDGYCNVFTLHLDSFQVYGNVTGCGKKSVEGGLSATVGGVPYIITNDQQDDRKHQYTWYFTPPSKKAGSWYLYSATTSGQVEANSGTYTVGAPQQPALRLKDATAH